MSKANQPREGYFTRLKSHPGLSIAGLFTVMGMLAGASNKSCEPHVGAIFGLIMSLVFVWGPVLISNFYRK